MADDQLENFFDNEENKENSSVTLIQKHVKVNVLKGSQNVVLSDLIQNIDTFNNPLVDEREILLNIHQSFKEQDLYETQEDSQIVEQENVQEEQLKSTSEIFKVNNGQTQTEDQNKPFEPSSLPKEENGNLDEESGDEDFIPENNELQEETDEDSEEQEREDENKENEELVQDQQNSTEQQIETENENSLDQNKLITSQILSNQRNQFKIQRGKEMATNITKISSNTKKTRKSLTSRAGLVFGVPLTKKLFKKTHSKLRLNKMAAVYFTAVLEYLTAELLEISGDVTHSFNKKRIIPHHIMMAIQRDEEFHNLLEHVTISFGGVMPNINPILYKSSKERQKMGSQALAKLEHDFIHGLTQQTKDKNKAIKITENSEKRKQPKHFPEEKESQQKYLDTAQQLDQETPPLSQLETQLLHFDRLQDSQEAIQQPQQQSQNQQKKQNSKENSSNEHKNQGGNQQQNGDSHGFEVNNNGDNGQNGGDDDQNDNGDKDYVQPEEEEKEEAEDEDEEEDDDSDESQDSAEDKEQIEKEKAEDKHREEVKKRAYKKVDEHHRRRSRTPLRDELSKEEYREYIHDVRSKAGKKGGRARSKSLEQEQKHQIGQNKGQGQRTRSESPDRNRDRERGRPRQRSPDLTEEEKQEIQDKLIDELKAKAEANRSKLTGRNRSKTPTRDLLSKEDYRNLMHEVRSRAAKRAAETRRRARSKSLEEEAEQESPAKKRGRPRKKSSSSETIQSEEASPKKPMTRGVSKKKSTPTTKSSSPQKKGRKRVEEVTPLRLTRKRRSVEEEEEEKSPKKKTSKKSEKEEQEIQSKILKEILTSEPDKDKDVKVTISTKNYNIELKSKFDFDNIIKQMMGGYVTNEGEQELKLNLPSKSKQQQEESYSEAEATPKKALGRPRKQKKTTEEQLPKESQEDIERYAQLGRKLIQDAQLKSKLSTDEIFDIISTGSSLKKFSPKKR